MIQTIYADAHPMMRQNIKTLLSKAGDIQLLGEADNGHDLLRLAKRFSPDVLVTDLMMTSLNGIEITEQIQALHLKTRVVVLSMDINEALVRQALEYGARGYLSKRNLTGELLPAIRAVHRGELYLDPAIVRPQIATASTIVSEIDTAHVKNNGHKEW